MEFQAEKSWETGAQVAFLVPPPAHQPWQQPQTTRAPRRALLAQRAPPLLLVVPDVGIGGGGRGAALPGAARARCPSPGQRHQDRRTCAEQPQALLLPPAPPAACVRNAGEKQTKTYWFLLY